MEVRVVYGSSSGFHIEVWDKFYLPEIKAKLKEFDFKYDRSYKSWHLSTKSIEEVRRICEILKEATKEFNFRFLDLEEMKTYSWEEFEKIQKEEEKKQ